MSEQERHDGRADAIEDLEVRDDEARDVAGGKKSGDKKAFAKGAKKSVEAKISARSTDLRSS